MSRVNALTRAALRFWPQVDVQGMDECWEWTGTRTDLGYGVFSARQVMRGSSSHRFAFILANGYTPAPGRDIDHLCRNRACANPKHLEDVTHRVNILRGDTFLARQARQTHCKHGHTLSGPNLYRKPNGDRICRECQARFKAEFHARNPGYRGPSQRRIA